MIDVPGRVPILVAIDVPLIVDSEDVVVLRLASSLGFRFVDSLTDVLDEASAFADFLLRKGSLPINR